MGAVDVLPVLPGKPEAGGPIAHIVPSTDVIIFLCISDLCLHSTALKKQSLCVPAYNSVKIVHCVREVRHIFCYVFIFITGDLEPSAGLSRTLRGESWCVRCRSGCNILSAVV